MRPDAQALVLGGGLTGCLVACGLADAGLNVTIVEREPLLVSAASYWNDGKIHLGYTFSGTASMASAELMQAGAASFIGGLERAIGVRVPDDWFSDGVIYLVDEGSMVDPEVLWQRATAIARSHGQRAATDAGMRRYLGSQAGLERLTVPAAERATGQTGIRAAWHTPERHVRTSAVARSLRTAVAERGIEVHIAEVANAAPAEGGWRIQFRDGGSATARTVVNCMWQDRALLDRSVSDTVEPTSIRYKRALFGTGVTALDDMSSSTRILGPYGDIVVHAKNEAYLGWYPVGMIARSDDGSPPPIPERDDEADMDAIVRALGLSPSILSEPGATWVLRGGYVVAWGYGDIDDPRSPLHERHRPRVNEPAPGFFSVDTGKYTLGPLLASQAVDAVVRASRTRPMAEVARATTPSAVDG